MMNNRQGMSWSTNLIQNCPETEDFQLFSIFLYHEGLNKSLVDDTQSQVAANVLL